MSASRLSIKSTACRRLLPITVALALCAAILQPLRTAQALGYASARSSTIVPPNSIIVSIGFEPVASGFNSPVFVTHAGDSRLFVVEQRGVIKIIKNGSVLGTPFLNLTALVLCCGEDGLLGLAFEPDYPTTGRFYVYYTNKSGDQVIARYRVSSDPDVADPSSGQILLTIPHPIYGNHNAGWIGFGPDGHLYAAVGDGGGGGDPFCAAQDPGDLRGKILRLNVVGQITYTIPAGNIFTTTQRPEVWAIGLRNPWRNSFDRQTGDLYIADVGQGAREEINFVPAGASAGLNFGWSQYEGSIPYSDGSSIGGSFDCPPSGIAPTMPITDYGRSLGGSVTGGYVYRGSDFPWLNGVYFYGDYVSGKLFAAWRPSPGAPFTSAFIRDTGYNISSFGEDVNGELYLVSYSGTIYRLRSEIRDKPAYLPFVLQE
ncbi:MAG: PQQ-dependent sugar dehydrogenase [Thermoflexales bacterium]|nr:PQQ-dependent sugar dehydrogenase [Thermoflexales bacterium]MDW8352067.1 PQQ-dependent sugar dehydrogenase [Anaerolineae bacterium]